MSTSSDPSAAYAGRWVARLGNQIIAQGGTPQQAWESARQTRSKEIPQIEFMAFPTPLTFSPLLDKVRQLTAGQEIYLVGGAVRDALLGRISHDLDFIIPRDGLRMARALAHQLNAAFYPLDAERDTGRIVLIAEGQRIFMDIASYRAPSLEEDLLDRDFTVNAIALDIHTGHLYDPLNGASDIRAKRLRACSPQAFVRDPLRVLRAIRLAAQLGFHISPETRAQLKEGAPLLQHVSAERQRDELFRILEGKQVSASLRALDLLGVLPLLFPELPPLKGTTQSAPHIYDVWQHTLSLLQFLEEILDLLTAEHDAERAADWLNGLLVLRLGRYRQTFHQRLKSGFVPERSRRGLLFLAALYHDVAKPLTRQVGDDGRIRFWNHELEAIPLIKQRAQDLRLSLAESDYLVTLVRNHMRIHHQTQAYLQSGKLPARRTVYRFFRDCGDAGIELVLLVLADLRAVFGPTLTQDLWAAALDVSRHLLENRLEHPEETVSPPRLLTGDELMAALNLSPGRHIGQLLEAIREAQACGEIHTREEALALARELASKMGR